MAVYTARILIVLPIVHLCQNFCPHLMLNRGDCQSAILNSACVYVKRPFTAFFLQYGSEGDLNGL